MPVTDDTDVTDAGRLPPFRVAIMERLDTLTDSLATSNRAAIAHNQELARLRQTIIFGVIFLVVLYWKRNS